MIQNHGIFQCHFFPHVFFPHGFPQGTDGCHVTSPSPRLHMAYVDGWLAPCGLKGDDDEKDDKDVRFENNEPIWEWFIAPIYLW